MFLPRSHMRPSEGERKKKAGFSLLEMMIVVAIMMIASAMAVPSIQRARRSYLLRTATVELATFLQRSRITAVQNNTALPVLTNGANTQVFLDLNRNGALDVGVPNVTTEPWVPLPTNITINAAGPAAPLTAAVTGFAPQPLPVRFDGRGLPCVINAGGVCSNWVAGGPGGGTQVGFLYYLLQNIPGGGRTWAAVTVNPAGQVKTWVKNGTVWTNN